MATYNLLTLLKPISEIINDGYLYAEISEIPTADEFPGSLSFSAVDNEREVGYDDVEPIPYNHDCSQDIEINLDTPCYIFTLKEIHTVLHALDNALEYFKECSSNKDNLYDRDTLDQIKSASVDFRNLQANIRKFLKHLS